MLVHIDPEAHLLADGANAHDDLDRAAFTEWLERESGRIWGIDTRWSPERIQLHYLNGRVEVEIMLPPAPAIDPEPEVIKQGVRDLQAAAHQAQLPLDTWVVYRRLTR